MAQGKSLLHEMTLTTPTEFWNDACDIPSLERAVEHGATGATSNPVIVLSAIRQDEAQWRRETLRLAQEEPSALDADIAWRLVEHAAVMGAKVLEPVFEKSNCRRGRLSVQVDPTLYRDADAMVAHGAKLASLAPNIAIKVPAVPAGLAAMEELTARGVVINATVSFTVPQAIAVAEAVERGLERAAQAGIEADTLTPWVTIMVGRLDDHLADVDQLLDYGLGRETIRWASTAVFRKSYRIFRERGFRATLLAAAMRSHHHWSEFIGGEVVITIPPTWQDKFNASDVEVRSRIDEPVPEEILTRLRETFIDFGRAYDEDGMGPDDFLSYGATIKTLHQFLGGYSDLVTFVHEARHSAPGDEPSAEC